MSLAGARPVMIGGYLLAGVQHYAADGGLIQSACYGPDKIRVGQLVREGGAWWAVTGRWRGECGMPVMMLRSPEGARHREVCMHGAYTAEVRLDTILDMTAEPPAEPPVSAVADPPAGGLTS